MKNVSPVIIAALLLLIAACPVLAQLPVANVDLSEIDSMEVYGDSVDTSALYEHAYEWHLGMTVNSPDVVTAPHIEFTSDDYIGYIDPPTSFSAPSTYIWDYPNKSLAFDRALFIDAGKYVAAAQAGFTVTRNVDVPVLIDNVTVQTVDVTMRIEEPIVGRNHLGV